MKKIKLEMHTHTRASYDVGMSYQDIITACVKKRIDVLVVTDHNETKGAFILQKLAPFRVIIGQEILTKDGEVIGLFLKKKIRKGMSMEKTLQQIKQQGAISYLPHPFDTTTRKTAITEFAIQKYVSDIDIIEVHNGRTIIPADNKKAFTFAKKNKKIIAVGSDVHTKYEYGRNYLIMDDFSTPQEFKLSVSKAELHTSYPLWYPFLITKYDRNKKRHKDFPLQKHIECDLCGGYEYEILYEKRGKAPSTYFISDDSYGAHSQIVKCVDCELVYSYPRDSSNKLISRYSDFEDNLYEKEREARMHNYQRILKRINTLMPQKGTLLDVGAATGAFVEIANKDGWRAQGIEPSEWAVSVAQKKHNLLMKRGTLDTARYKGKFDCIVCIDVIEHVDSPSLLLQQMKKLLTNDGLLVIITPDKGSFVARLMGESWWHVRPDHIYYFTQATFSLLLARHDLNIVKRKYYAWQFSYEYWISRIKKPLPSLYKYFQFLKKIPIISGLTKKNYTLSFFDSMELYVKKEL